MAAAAGGRALLVRATAVAAWLGAKDGSNRLAANRRLRATLRELGHDVTQDEPDVGHDYLSWQAGLLRGVERLLGGAGFR